MSQQDGIGTTLSMFADHAPFAQHASAAFESPLLPQRCARCDQSAMQVIENEEKLRLADQEVERLRQQVAQLTLLGVPPAQKSPSTVEAAAANAPVVATVDNATGPGGAHVAATVPAAAPVVARGIPRGVPRVSLIRRTLSFK
jgi:hypothetical protein